MVDGVGAGVTAWRPGDAVFGVRTGAFGEYVVVRAQGGLRPGQKVLVNGASGGVGTYAVQIARAMGAEVSGVCSTRNLAMVRELGADRVIDHTREDFAAAGPVYDLVVDLVGNRAPAEVLGALRPDGRWVIVGAPSAGPWLGPVAGLLRALARAPFASQEIVALVTTDDRADLEALARMAEAGEIRPVIEVAEPPRT